MWKYMENFSFEGYLIKIHKALDIRWILGDVQKSPNSYKLAPTQALTHLSGFLWVEMLTGDTASNSYDNKTDR